MTEFHSKLLSKSLLFICVLSVVLSHSATTSYDVWKTEICSATPQFAKGFTLNCENKLVELFINLNKEDSIKFELVPRDLQTSRSQLAIPVRSYASLSATHISHLKKLNLLDQMVGFSRIQDLNEKWLLKKHKNGSLKELGMIQSIRIESIIALKPDVIFGYHFPGIENQMSNLSRNGIQMIYINEYLESSPMAYVEWIKLFGILFNKTKLAIAKFNEIKSRYFAISSKAKMQIKKPSVLVNIPYGSTWFVPAGDNFMAHLIKDAGGSYVFADTKGNFNLKLSLEAVIESGLEADFWINPGQHTQKTSLLREDPRFALFKAYKNNRIFNNTKAILEQRTNDYFSRGLSNPDLLLADLVKIFHPNLQPNRQLEWFHSLSD